MAESQKKRHRYKARIVSGLTTLFLLVAVVICLYVVVQSMSHGYVRIGGYSLFRVVTGSMEPTIPVGTVLLAEETPIGEVAEDDIVCFRSTNPGSEGMIVTHRVMKVYDSPDGVRCLMTKGDNNQSMDVNPVKQDNLIGRIIRHTGEGNKMAGMINFLTGDFGFLACIVLPVLLVAVWIFRDASKNLKQEIENVEARLDEQERAKRARTPVAEAETSAPAMTDDEYQQLYEQIKNEVRKEMEQDAQSDPSDQDGAEPCDQASAAAPSEQSDG